MENVAANAHHQQQQSRTEASVKAIETAKKHNESLTGDLSDPREDNKLDLTPDEEDTSAQMLFNKTQTDNQMLLAVSNQNSDAAGETTLG